MQNANRLHETSHGQEHRRVMVSTLQTIPPYGEQGMTGRGMVNALYKICPALPYQDCDILKTTALVRSGLDLAFTSACI